MIIRKQEGEHEVVIARSREPGVPDVAVMTIDGHSGVTTFHAPVLGISGAAPVAPQLADGSVTKAKMAVFASGERIGTGTMEKISHNLGSIPAIVLVIPLSGHNDKGASGALAASVSEGHHSASNVLVNVSKGAKYKLVALA